ncbi:MAG TPA: alpha/beta hydrolase family protein [Pyrinomonadaceae bacterium]|nr:alpha/beta hydrolase family protein [Pyrinomonadaceae bacterium]
MKLTNRSSILSLLVLLLALTFSLPLSAQQPGKKLPDLKLASKLMGRDMSYRVVLPPDYNSSVDGPVNKGGSRYPVIYLLHGLTGNFANWTDKTKLTEYALNHRFIIVTPDGGNGWYTDSVSVPNDKYESYIIKELIPEIDKTYRTISTRDGRVIAGLSMGGYGSLKFGLKYPEMFTLIGSFSGALGATSWTEKTAGATGRSMDAVFGTDEAGETRKSNDIFKMVRELTPEKVKSLPYVYQSCGTEDFLIQNNRDFLKLLNDAKVPHEYREHPGVHDWVFWDAQVREFLDLADRRIKR